MKVKDLIEKLNKADPEAEVWVSIDRNEECEEQERWIQARSITRVRLRESAPEAIGIH